MPITLEINLVSKEHIESRFISSVDPVSVIDFPASSWELNKRVKAMPELILMPKPLMRRGHPTTSDYWTGPEDFSYVTCQALARVLEQEIELADDGKVTEEDEARDERIAIIRREAHKRLVHLEAEMEHAEAEMEHAGEKVTDIQWHLLRDAQDEHRWICEVQSIAQYLRDMDEHFVAVLFWS